MTRLFAGLLAVAIGFAGSSAAEDKKKDKKPAAPALKGVWVHELDNGTLTFDFQSKDRLVGTVDLGGNKLTVTCKYEVDKGGQVKAAVTGTEGDSPTKPEKGFKFQFTFKVDGDKATVSDFTGDDTDGAKQAVEGEYKKKAEK